MNKFRDICGFYPKYPVAYAGYGQVIAKKEFMLWFALVPAIFMFAAAAIVLFFYKITDKDAAFYAEENAKKDSCGQNGQ